MANRIPPSLKWLIDKRARISGEIEKTRRSLERAQSLIDELEDLETKLKAIDTTLEMHDIPVDTSLIQPIKSKYYRLKIPHGELTKSILTCIKLYGENAPVSKATIMNFVITRHFDFDADTVALTQVALSVKRRLGNLYHEGYIVRHHSPITSDDGLWTLSPEYKNF
jgi:hypothetical protein